MERVSPEEFVAEYNRLIGYGCKIYKLYRKRYGLTQLEEWHAIHRTLICSCLDGEMLYVLVNTDGYYVCFINEEVEHTDE